MLLRNLHNIGLVLLHNDLLGLVATVSDGLLHHQPLVRVGLDVDPFVTVTLLNLQNLTGLCDELLIVDIALRKRSIR